MDANFKKIVLEKKKARLEECLALGQNCYDLEIPDSMKSKVPVDLDDVDENFEKAEELFYKSSLFFMLENLLGKMSYYFSFLTDDESFTLVYSHEDFSSDSLFFGEPEFKDISSESSKSTKKLSIWEEKKAQGVIKYLETRKDPFSYYRIAPVSKAESMNYTESSIKSLGASLLKNENKPEPCVQVGSFQAEIDRKREQDSAQNAFQSSFDISDLPTFGSLDSGDEV